jgi:hypothetical protein
VWLHQLGGLLQLSQLVCAMRVVGGQRVMSVRSSGERGDEPGARSCDAAVCRLSLRLAAHPAAARIRAIRNRSARLEASQVPIQRARHGSVECASWHCDPVGRASREDRMICTLRMIGCKRLDMCTEVLYEYKLPSDVPYGFIYLILSFPTRVDAVWRALRPFKEG